MKSYLTVLFLMLAFAATSFAQQIGEFDRDSAYMVMADLVVTEYDFINKKKLTGKKIARRGNQFYVVDYVGGDNIYVLKFWDFRKKKQAPSAADLAPSSTSPYLSEEDNDLYYYIKRDDIANKVEISNNYKAFGLSFSTTLIPVKLRFGDSGEKYFNFATDFTIGPSVGAKYRLKKDRATYLNLIAGFGLSSVAVDSITTKGVIPTSTNLAGVTPFGGITLEFNHFQFGVFTGADFLTRRPGRNWIYQGSPWISIGLGYQILANTNRPAAVKSPRNK